MIGRNPSATFIYYWPGYVSMVRVSNIGRYASAFTLSTSYTSDANTVLFLQFNNAGIFDQTRRNNIETVGNAGVSTAVTRFGLPTTSYNGSTGSLVLPNTGNFSLTGSNFTIEAHIYLTAFSPSYSGVHRAAICGSSTNASAGFEFTVAGTSSSYTGLTFTVSSGGSVTASFPFALNTHYFVMVTRSGNIYTFSVNGTPLTTTGTAPTTWTEPSTFYVGRIQHPSFTYWFPGYLFDLRVTKGIARPNVVPTAPFPLY
jgi:hypothetical protein